MNRELAYGLHLLLRGIILIGFFLLIFKLLITGDIHRFIAPKMISFQYFTITVFFILGFMQIWRSGSKRMEDLYCNCGFDHNQNGSFVQTLFIYLLFFLPVISGLLFPNTVLDSSVVAKRGIKYGSSVYAEQLADHDNLAGEDQENVMMSDEEEKLKAEFLNHDKINVEEERYLEILDFLHDYPHVFLGKEVEIVGFVFKEPEFEDHQFVIARFVVACCVADASVYGLLSTIDHGQDVLTDEWVKVTGILSTTMVQGQELPYLKINQVEKVEQPENPYVYEMLKPLIE
ncbi:TIGR03943 family protein [Bacillus sp. FJAT-50079]|uniref:TIGR03943 family putative permease subunit n=1 Tax=Bacillus sp. FJAT-50079 TaxID=2833577 RepID=UPI001BC99444|nr:TIGR03943 family protein [Bacillus sp. FJAT-50079]MBS4209493.1 TIGR03943 family protein [Bacillus sp. FJAT-50079]